MRRFLTVALLLIGAHVALAQGLLVGASVGRTSATQHHSQRSFDYDRVHGATAAATALVELFPWLGLQAEAAYAERGGRQGQFYEMRIDYLELPLLARAATPFAYHGLRAVLLGGVSWGVEYRCSGYTVPPTILNRSSPPPGSVPLDCSSQRLRYSDRGRVVGGGIQLDHGEYRFSLEARRFRGRDIAGYSCCALTNDATAITIGAARRLR
ncbi:MAG TPA: hypothetical protein VFT29_09610 [Gemmatimonadaceae bacterium]|nr:hypothetical protein [Gemmatimonadaceae bacterium]